MSRASHRWRQRMACVWGTALIALGCERSHATSQISTAATTPSERAANNGQPPPSGGPLNLGLANPRAAQVTARAFVADSCVRDESGGVWCWHGGPGAAPSTPTRIREFEGATAVIAAPVFDYVLRSDGSVWTYGIAKDPGGAARARGEHIYKDARVPERFEPLSNIVAISANVFGLALNASGDLYSWNEAYERNSEGECTGYQRTVPTRVTSLPKSKGLADWYAIEQSGRLFSVGFETDQKTLRPIWIPEVKGVMQVISCSGNKIDACALSETGAVKCWKGPVGTGKLKMAPAVTGLPETARIACSEDELYAIDRVGDLFAWDFAKAREGSAAVHARGLHAVADIQPHLGTVVRPHCLIDRAGVVGCWATDHRLGQGNWVSWVGALEGRPFTGVTEPILQGVDLAQMHPAIAPP